MVLIETHEINKKCIKNCDDIYTLCDELCFVTTENHNVCTQCMIKYYENRRTTILDEILEENQNTIFFMNHIIKIIGRFDPNLIKNYEIIAENGNDVALNQLGCYYQYSQANYNLAVKYYLRAISKGNFVAANNLGYYYYSIANDNLAIKYYLLAINNGEVSSMVNLGLLYQMVIINYDLMKKYYLMAIEKNNVNAMNNLGFYYQTTEINPDLMKKYYLMGIELGDVPLMNTLGYYYHVVEKNYVLARKYYLMAVNNGNYARLVELCELMNIVNVYYSIDNKSYFSEHNNIKEINDFIQSTTIKKSGIVIQPKHLLFKGRPGIEKTQLASYLANELKSNVYVVNTNSILSQKKPLKTMSFLFKKTHKRPTIIVLNEIEFLLDNPGLYHQFLTYLQNCPHPIFATSNLDDIHIKLETLCRPGCFNVVHIPLLKDEYKKKAITNKFTQLFQANPEQKTFDLIEKYLPQGEISGAYINDFGEILFSLTKGKIENINEKVIKDSVNYFNQKK